MLKEIFATRQNSRYLMKRWFTDSSMDLFIWFRNQAPVRFQLSYNRHGDEYAINWNTNTGFSHSRIDPGEQFDPLKYKMSPILLADGEFDALTTARTFLRASKNIEESLADFIYARLFEYPGQHVIHPGQTPVSRDL